MFAKKYKSIVVAINNAFEGIYTLGHLEKPYNLWYNKLSTIREEKL